MNQNATKVLVVVSVNGEVLRQFSMSAHAESAKSEISACATDAVFTYNNYAVAKFHYLATTALGDVFAEGDVDIGADVAREQEKDARSDDSVSWQVRVADEDGTVLSTINAAWQPTDVTVDDVRSWTDGGSLTRDAFVDWISTDGTDGNGVYKLTLVVDGKAYENTTETIEWNFDAYQDGLLDFDDMSDDE